MSGGLKENQRRRYADWGQLLRRYRAKKYRSAREFTQKTDLGISYPQYSRYEAGEQLPSLDQAWVILKVLEVPKPEGLSIWCQSQVADAQAKDQIEQLMNKKSGPPEPEPAPIVNLDPNHSIILNRTHIELFRSNPIFRDLVTLINSYAPDSVDKKKIAKVMKVEAGQLDQWISPLVAHGLIVVRGEELQGAKEVIFIPDDQDFFEMRNEAFMQNASSILERISFEEIRDQKAVRALSTRDLSPEQIAWLVEELGSLIKRVVALPAANPEDPVYSLCLLLGSRFDRS